MKIDESDKTLLKVLLAGIILIIGAFICNYFNYLICSRLCSNIGASFVGCFIGLELHKTFILDKEYEENEKRRK